MNLQAQPSATYLCLTTNLEELPIAAYLCLPAPYRKELQSYLKKSLPVSSFSTNLQEGHNFATSLHFPASYRQGFNFT